MKTIYELFSNLHTKDIDTVLNEFGINVPHDFSFSKTSIIIGINGSGKTRFLKAIKELCLLNKERVIYGYFPKLSHKKINVEYTEDNLPDATLIESLMYNYDFEDFLEEIQNQNESFISSLLHYQSRVQKKNNDKVLSYISTTFSQLTGFKIVIDKKKVLLEKDGIKEPLESIINQFSPGQLMLFYLSIFISFQNKDIQKVIILDEPECHLHPNALLEFINILKKTEWFSHLFIATHSLFLVPEFDFENIVYLDNSQVISRNSGLYINLISDMLGKDYEKKTTFFSSIYQWQFAEYLAECFKEPEIIDKINPKDEQVNLFIELLKKKKSIKVLDFGAGTARLGRSFLETNYKDKNKIQYEVYDIKLPDNRYGFKYYNQLNDVPKKYYDCVVMMNVLHEIDPSKWVEIFSNIYKIMADGSYLLFVETSILSKGELPNTTGYLVLDNDELQKLFNCNEEFPSIKLSKQQKSTCIIIKKKYLLNISDLTVHMAIKELEKNTYNRIIEERKSNQSPRKYAFLTQLYLNAKILNDNYLMLRKNSVFLNGKPISYTNFSPDDRLALMNKIHDYSNKVVTKTKNDCLAKELLRNLIYYVERGIDINKIILEYTYNELINLINNNTRKSLISVCLLTLILTEYDKAEKIFNENHYYRYLPPKIKEILESLTIPTV